MMCLKMDKMTEKFNELTEELKSMFVVSQAMAKNNFNSTSQQPVDGKTDNPDPPPMPKEPHPCNYVNLKRAERTIPSTEFTERLRKFVKMYENELPRRAEITFLEEAIEFIEQSQKAPEQPAAGEFTKIVRRIVQEFVDLYGPQPEFFPPISPETLFDLCDRLDSAEAEIKTFADWREKLEKQARIDNAVVRDARTKLDSAEARLKDLLTALEEAADDFYYIHQHSEDAYTDSYNFMEKVNKAKLMKRKRKWKNGKL